ncbi:hypothetical protein C815_02254 [Firmicutes bacterium M10-2]|nr:hypothetical protein C815_02254 [Firmicutes bacterium M10-2]
MEAKGSTLLKVVGYIFVILGIVSLCIQIGGLISDDIIGTVQGNAIGQMFILDSGSLAVGMLVSVVEMAAGYMAVKMASNLLYAKTLMYYGIGMIVIFVVEAMFYFQENGNVSWLAYGIVIVLSILYIIGAYMNKKEAK